MAGAIEEFGKARFGFPQKCDDTLQRLRTVRSELKNNLSDELSKLSKDDGGNPIHDRKSWKDWSEATQHIEDIQRCESVLRGVKIVSDRMTWRIKERSQGSSYLSYTFQELCKPPDSRSEFLRDDTVLIGRLPVTADEGFLAVLEYCDSPEISSTWERSRSTKSLMAKRL